MVPRGRADQSQGCLRPSEPPAPCRAASGWVVGLLGAGGVESLQGLLLLGALQGLHPGCQMALPRPSLREDLTPVKGSSQHRASGGGGGARQG